MFDAVELIGHDDSVNALVILEKFISDTEVPEIDPNLVSDIIKLKEEVSYIEACDCNHLWQLAQDDYMHQHATYIEVCRNYQRVSVAADEILIEIVEYLIAFSADRLSNGVKRDIVSRLKQEIENFVISKKPNDCAPSLLDAQAYKEMVVQKIRSELSKKRLLYEDQSRKQRAAADAIEHTMRVVEDMRAQQ